jgi:hypothetical protein
MFGDGARPDNVSLLWSEEESFGVRAIYKHVAPLEPGPVERNSLWLL